MGELIINGVGRPVNATVRTWHETGLEFPHGECGSRDRSHPCRLGVLHWTGGEGDGPRVHRVLHDRGLSIHFALDREGVIWQYADPGLTACAHVGKSANPVSWGVEVVDYGWVAKGARVPARGVPRERYEAVIQGQKMTVADYLPDQYCALGALCDVVCDTLGIPRVVWPGPSELAPWSELGAFTGMCGHMHISRRKADPGTRPLDWLRKRWGLTRG